MPIATINPSTGLEEMRALCVGDPMDPATDVGPEVTEGSRTDVAEPAGDALSHGAEVFRSAGSRGSGHGRALAASGIRKFCGRKTVWKA